MRKIPIVLGVILFLVLAWATYAGNLSAAIDWTVTRPWGNALLVDFYVGIILFGLVLWRLEHHPVFAVLWFLPSLILGFLVPAIYLALNVHRIGQKGRT